MLSKLSKNQQRNTQKPKFSRLRRSQEQKVIQMCLYLYLYYKIILSELFLDICAKRLFPPPVASDRTVRACVRKVITF